MKIITNNVPRYVIEAHELSEAEREEFDYIDWPAIERGEDSATFMRYKGQLYDLSEFTTVTVTIGPYEWLKGWDGWQSDTYFSGTLIKWIGPDFEEVIVGRYYT